MSIPICMWSGPRNLSTAMMRSFGSRADCSVLDEPFFAPFLKVTGKAHPGRKETLERHETDANIVAARCVAKIETPYHFQKHMPHHMLPEFPLDWAKGAKHFFLLREPSRVIRSYIRGRGAFEIDDLGFGPQARLFEHFTDQDGTPPPVIESTDILKAPERALKRLCEALDIPFDFAMLSWPAGSRPEDGAWAPYWYKSVEASTGFVTSNAAPSALPDKLPDDYSDILKVCEADYATLYKLRLSV